MPWFEYHQNNSGGRFVFEEERGLTHFVIIEAKNARAANRRAEDIGLYFDGAGDCPCCGDRWSDAWEDDKGTREPELYGEPVAEFKSYWGGWMPEGKEVAVHPLEGPVQWYGVKKEELDA